MSKECGKKVSPTMRSKGKSASVIHHVKNSISHSLTLEKRGKDQKRREVSILGKYKARRGGNIGKLLSAVIKKELRGYRNQSP